jgi:hypothetical protein
MGEGEGTGRRAKEQGGGRRAKGRREPELKIPARMTSVGQACSFIQSVYPRPNVPFGTGGPARMNSFRRAWQVSSHFALRTSLFSLSPTNFLQQLKISFFYIS